MNLQKQQDFLARLFTDESLRRNFLSNSKKIGLEYGLNEKDIAALETVLPEQLNFFADSLFWKRLREAEKFLPETKKELGENFVNLFRKFSQKFNPQSVKKHLEDAFNFCLFLQKQNDLSKQTKSIAEFERAKLAFFGYNKRCVISQFDYDFKTRKNRKTFAVWFRFGGKNYHYKW